MSCENGMSGQGPWTVGLPHFGMRLSIYRKKITSGPPLFLSSLRCGWGNSSNPIGRVKCICFALCCGRIVKSAGIEFTTIWPEMPERPLGAIESRQKHRIGTRPDGQFPSSRCAPASGITPSNQIESNPSLTRRRTPARRRAGGRRRNGRAGPRASAGPRPSSGRRRSGSGCESGTRSAG
jgi:hypothetical protein